MFDSAMRRRSAKPKASTLNLTSMMDMLSIILVFLLCSISAEPEVRARPGGPQLPPSTSEKAFVRGVTIELSATSLRVQDSFVAAVRGGQLVGVELDGDTIVPLRNLLLRHRARAKEMTVVLNADRRLPFRTINRVMRTAAQAGFPNFRLSTSTKR